jgi:RNA polymerase sigma-32 factor
LANDLMPCPSLGTLDAYIRAVNDIPVLSQTDETQLAIRLRDHGDSNAAQTLVMSHLRMPVAIARGYLGYGIPHSDLIQEGNIGLMRAVKGFDPDAGTRLSTYAMHWIKADIHEYAIKNTRLVKSATTKAQRKLFFKLRGLKAQMQANTDRPMVSMTTEQVFQVAELLNVKPSDVREMERRLTGSDIAIDTQDDANDDSDYSPSNYLSDENDEPSRILASLQQQDLETNGLHEAIEMLDPRSKDIVKRRWIDLREGDTGATLSDMASIYNVSAERIRQIEAAAFIKIKKQLASFY